MAARQTAEHARLQVRAPRPPNTHQRQSAGESRTHKLTLHLTLPLTLTIPLSRLQRRHELLARALSDPSSAAARSAAAEAHGGEDRLALEIQQVRSSRWAAKATAPTRSQPRQRGSQAGARASQALALGSRLSGMGGQRVY